MAQYDVGLQLGQIINYCNLNVNCSSTLTNPSRITTCMMLSGLGDFCFYILDICFNKEHTWPKSYSYS